MVKKNGCCDKSQNSGGNMYETFGKSTQATIKPLDHSITDHYTVQTRKGDALFRASISKPENKQSTTSQYNPYKTTDGYICAGR